MRRVDLAVRPEQLAVGQGSPGQVDLGLHTVIEALFLGGRWRVMAASERGEGAAARPLLLHLPPASAPHPGERLRVAVAPGCLTLLE